MINIEYQTVNTKYFSKNDYDYLEELKTLLKTNPKPDEIQSILNKYSTVPINSILRGIELDLEGYFKLRKSETTINCLKEKFETLTDKEIFSQLLQNLEVIKEGDFEMAESLYQVKTIQLEYQNEKIPVKEILVSPFDFILYENSEKSEEFFLEIVTGSHFVYTLLYKVENQDLKIVKSLNKDKISALTRKYLAKK